MDPCSECGHTTAWNEVACPRCGCALRPPPNVRYARAQRAAVARNAATAQAAHPGAAAALDAAAATTRATVSMPPAVARNVLSGALYAAYAGTVVGGVRRVASPQDDQTRAAVEGRMYGTHGVGQIRYAALTLDGRGLRSYGTVAATLHDDAVANRASVLSGNSYAVVGSRPAKDPFPEGELSTWDDRAALVVATRAAGMPSPFDAADVHDAVLWQEGDRGTDRFFEVHLWGPFNASAVAEWRVLVAPTDPDDRLDLDIAARKAAAAKVPWHPA